MLNYIGWMVVFFPNDPKNWVPDEQMGDGDGGGVIIDRNKRKNDVRDLWQSIPNYCLLQKQKK